MSDESKLQCQKFPAPEDVARRILLRYGLLNVGYEPIPVCGKAPRIGGWSAGPIDEERTFAWSTDRNWFIPVLLDDSPIPSRRISNAENLSHIQPSTYSKIGMLV